MVDTVAGAPRAVVDGIQATSSFINAPHGLVLDSAGNVVFSDTGNHRVRRITPAGVISTIAGTGAPGNAGDGGAAAAAQMISPWGLALDAAGNLYVADRDANVVRRIATDGGITTVAGSGQTGAPGTFGNGGKATNAALLTPSALALDKAGVLYITEDLANTIRKVTPDGQINALSTASFNGVQGIAVDAAGNIYISVTGDNRIVRISPAGQTTFLAGGGTGPSLGDGGPATDAILNAPTALVADSAGNIFVCDSGNNRIRKITPAGLITSAVGSGSIGLNSVGGDSSSVSVYSPAGIAVDAKGTVYWTEAGNHRVRSLNPVNRLVTDLAGTTPTITGSSAAALPLLNPSGVAADRSGNFYIADTGNHVVRRVTPGGGAGIVAGTGQPNLNGDFGDALTLNLTYPRVVSVDPEGNLYIADTGNRRIRKVDTGGIMSTRMGQGTSPPVDGGFVGSASIPLPSGVVGESGGAFSTLDQKTGIVARADATGTVTLTPLTGVDSLLQPGALFTTTDTVYIADTLNHRIVRIDPFDPATAAYKPRASIVAGSGRPGYAGDTGDATRAQLNSPRGILVDGAGRLYIADTANHVIRMVDTNGIITTVAGSGKAGFSGDKAPALGARFALPAGMAFDNSGNILVADQANQRIRQLQSVASQPDVLVTVDPSSRSANRGGSVSFTVTLTSIAGFNGPVALSASSSPALSFQFSPAAPLNIVSGIPLNFTATAQIPVLLEPGPLAVTFTALVGTLRSAIATVVVVNPPAFSAAGVVNAASGVAGGVSPGEVIAIYGANLGPASLALAAFDSNSVLATQAGGTQVFFDGKAAPLLYSVSGQVAAIAPYALAGQSITQLQLSYNGVRSPVVAVNVVDAAPAVFALPGSTQAVALNQDLSLNNESNPAAPGSIVVLYGTGEGATNPAGVDGKRTGSTPAAPVLPVAVTVGGFPAQILYAAAAPSQVAGVFQLNIRVPVEAASGAMPVVVIVGARVSSGNVTISIR